MNKKKKNNNKFGILISKVFLVITVIFLCTIIFLNILPFRYLLLVILLMGVILLTLSFFNSYKRVKKKVRGVSIFLTLILMFIYSFGFYYIVKTYGFMDNINNKVSYKEYYIMSLKENNYNKNNISNKIIDAYNDNFNKFSEVISKLKDDYKLIVKEKKSIRDIKDDLIEEEVDLMLINGAIKNYLETEDYEFFKELSLVDTIKIEVVSENEDNDINISKTPFNVYITGIDTYGDIDTTSRSDVNMIASVNPNTGDILLTSIPRDYYVQLHDTTGYKDKLTHAGLYGTDMSISTIEDLLDIDINYYVKVNFSSLVSLVNLIGGVDVYSDLEFVPHAKKDIVIEEGINHMDGETALAFARERYAYSEGDVHRVQNQQDVVMAIIKKMTSDLTLLAKYTSILDSVEGGFDTNIKMSDLAKLVKKQLDVNPSWNIDRYILKGSDGYEYTYSMGEIYAYVMLPDEECVSEAHDKIISVIEGVKVQEEDNTY